MSRAPDAKHAALKRGASGEWLAAMALRGTAAEDALRGQPLTDASMEPAAQAAMAACDPAEDLRGSVDYKRAMAGQMLQRAIRQAATRCA